MIAAGEPEVSASGDFHRQLRFAGRIHRLRTLGLGLGFFCVASVLRLHDEPAWLWALLMLDGFAWPHLAWLLARRSAAPKAAEMRNLMADSAFGGAWIAVMQFNLLPSVLLATMLCVDKLNVAGLPLLLRTAPLLVGTCALTSALLGFPVDAETPFSVVAACLPFLVGYPLAMSAATQALAIRVVRQNKSLEVLARTDSLTGLANHSELRRCAERELLRHRRSNRPAVLLMLDIDRFKSVNDRHGHLVGDEVLRAVAKLLRECCRETDTPARYGGDEFAIVLAETDLEGAREIAQRLHERVHGLVLPVPRMSCRLSIGLAETRDAIRNVDQWIREADAALYGAKPELIEQIAGEVPPGS
jgi:diguanylate cyclase